MKESFGRKFVMRRTRSQGETSLHLETMLLCDRLEYLNELTLRQAFAVIVWELGNAGPQPDDFDRVILVGGSTRIAQKKATAGCQ